MANSSGYVLTHEWLQSEAEKSTSIGDQAYLHGLVPLIRRNALIHPSQMDATLKTLLNFCRGVRYDGSARGMDMEIARNTMLMSTFLNSLSCD